MGQSTSQQGSSLHVSSAAAATTVAVISREGSGSVEPPIVVGGGGGVLLSIVRAASTGGRAFPVGGTPPASPAFNAAPQLPPVDRSAKALAQAMSLPGAPEPPLWREVFRFLRNPHKVSKAWKF